MDISYSLLTILLNVLNSMIVCRSLISQCMSICIAELKELALACQLCKKSDGSALTPQEVLEKN